MLRRAVSVLSQMFIGDAPARRSLEASAAGRRWEDVPGVRDPAGMVHGGAATAAARAAQQLPSNPHLTRAVDAMTASLVGVGFRARPQHPNELERERLARSWLAWTEVADADGFEPFFALVASAVRDMIVLGEALSVWGTDPETAEPTLRRLHPEQLDRAKNSWTNGGARISQGVELDQFGRPVAYWIRPASPGDIGALTAQTAVRVARSEVLHIFKPLYPGQRRGLSWLAPVMLASHEFHGFVDASLERQRLAAARLGVVQMDPAALEDAPYDADSTSDFLNSAVKKMPQASFVQLVPGESMTFSDVPDAGNVEEFATAMLRMIAAGIGITFEQLSGDYSKVNYSSARAAMLEFRRFVQSIQQNILIPQLARPAWRRFIQHEILMGRISAASYQADPSAFGVRWLPPHWASVDPVKDAQAAVMELSAGLRSRAELAAERGFDIEELDRQIAADQARADALGLRFAAAPAAEPLTEDAQ